MAEVEYTPVARSKNGTPLFNCVCPDCGKVRVQDKRKIGRPCLPCANKRRSTHGITGTALHRLYVSMVARCTYQTATNYKYYGGRGIDVCSEWRSSPEAFFDWALKNGYRQGLELDRRDTDRNYEPGNCRFITHAENSQRRRNARCNIDQAAAAKKLLASGGSVSAAAKAVGIPYMSAWHISKGNTWRNA